MIGWITAEVLIKLSAKLFAANAHVDPTKSAAVVIKAPPVDVLRSQESNVLLVSPDKQLRQTEQLRMLGKFASPGRFDQLVDEGDEDSISSTSSDNNGVSISQHPTNLMDADIDENFRNISKSSMKGAASNTKYPQKSTIPQSAQKNNSDQRRFLSFEDPFWKNLGNSLRIFGIEDDVMHLDVE